MEKGSTVHRRVGTALHCACVAVVLLLTSQPVLADGGWDDHPLIQQINMERSRHDAGPLLHTHHGTSLHEDNNKAILSTQKSGHYLDYGDAMVRFLVRADFWAYSDVTQYWPQRKGPPSWSRIVELFKSSPPHWKALMHPKFTHINFGWMEDRNGIAVTVILLQATPPWEIRREH